MMSKKCSAIITMIMSLTMVPGFQGTTQSNTSEQNNKTAGPHSLEFNPQNYTSKTITVDSNTIKYRAYENIVYVKNLVDINYQIMNIYIPEDYFQCKTIGIYTADTAPIFFSNSVGGYMPGAPGTISDSSSGNNRSAPNGGSIAASVALSKGYVVTMPGARGRTTQDANGQYNGKAPAAIVDLKAAVRYLHYNDKAMPGDTNKIIFNGTSAGGALSALLGATGDNADYQIYLKALGAADASDAIFASSNYCPITNLDNADMAYEQQFNGINDYKGMGESGTMTPYQLKLSYELKKLFPAYVKGK